MADFLSPEWMAQVVAAAPGIDPAVAFTLKQVVLATPRGDLICIICLADGHMTMNQGSADHASDMTVRVPYPVSVGLATGDVSVHDAILDGAIKVSGDLNRLHEATAALGTIAAAMGQVQELTAYPR